MSHTLSPNRMPPDDPTADDADGEHAGPVEAHAGPVGAGHERARDADPERYRLLSIENVPAPEGCAGRDWYVYRIAQGDNAITGYRRGTRSTVSAEVDTVVANLNGRRQWAKPKPDSKAQRRAAAAARRKGAE